MKLFTAILFVGFLNEINCWRFFHRGRKVGGNVRAPVEFRGNFVEVWEDLFTQKLDHFNSSDNKTWLQRYQGNSQFFNNTGGPVFLMIGGESPASKIWMVSGFWQTLAQKYGALMFQVEHRYYGESQPTENLSVENLKYLSSEQALADLANFISSMNKKFDFSNDVKWIVFGGSYSGSLAAWLRLKYPDLVRGAVSSSGPLLAEVDFSDYLKVLAQSLSTYSDECVDAVEIATELLEILLSNTSGLKSLGDKFKVCDPLEKFAVFEQQRSNFEELLTDNIASVVQYNKINPAADPTIDDLCNIMVNESIGTPLDRFSEVNSFILNHQGQTCLDYNYDTMIRSLSETSWSLNEGGRRQWTYQTCTEFGFFQSSSNRPQIFGSLFPVDFFIQQCIDIFGPNFNATFLDRGTRWTNTFYGALDIDVSNVVFVHGSIDPWHALGVTETRQQEAPAIYIEGTAHCADMYSPELNELPQLTAAKDEIDTLIASWLLL